MQLGRFLLENITVGTFFSYLSAAALLIDPVGHTTNNYNLFKEGEASVDRVFELLAIKAAVVEKPRRDDSSQSYG